MMMKKVNYINWFISIICLFTVISCKQNQNGEPDDTPTSGTINISVDETFKPIIDTEINTFQSIYKFAKINVSYKSEGNAFQDLVDDSSRMIIVTRDLTPIEKKHFEDIKLFPHVT